MNVRAKEMLEILWSLSAFPLGRCLGNQAMNATLVLLDERTGAARREGLLKPSSSMYQPELIVAYNHFQRLMIELTISNIDFKDQ